MTLYLHEQLTALTPLLPLWCSLGHPPRRNHEDGKVGSTVVTTFRVRTVHYLPLEHERHDIICIKLFKGVDVDALQKLRVTILLRNEFLVVGSG